MANQVFVSRPLTLKNMEHEIRSAANSLPRHFLSQRLGLAMGDSDEFHRCLVVAVHCDCEKVRRLAKWW